MRAQARGDEHAQTLNAMNCLALLHMSAGDYVHAASRYADVIAVLRRVMPPEFHEADRGLTESGHDGTSDVSCVLGTLNHPLTSGVAVRPPAPRRREVPMAGPVP